MYVCMMYAWICFCMSARAPSAAASRTRPARLAPSQSCAHSLSMVIMQLITVMNMISIINVIMSLVITNNNNTHMCVLILLSLLSSLSISS